MKRNRFLATLGALCAAAFGVRASDRRYLVLIDPGTDEGDHHVVTAEGCSDAADPITHGPAVHQNGGVCVGFGFQFFPADDAKRERYAALFGPKDTRGDVVRRLRLLADQIEHGVGGARGSQPLLPNAIGIADYGDVDREANVARFGDDH